MKRVPKTTAARVQTLVEQAALLVDALIAHREAELAGSGQEVRRALRAGAGVELRVLMGEDGLRRLEMFAAVGNERISLCDVTPKGTSH